MGNFHAFVAVDENVEVKFPLRDSITSNFMTKTMRQIALLILTFGVLSVYAQKQITEIRNDFKKYYDQFKVDGSFILYDQNNDKFIVYNQPQTKEQFTPSSIYKICNSLIGLETGVITDENFIIKWDSVTRQNLNWNKDHDLKNAFRNSTVWYYQETGGMKGTGEVSGEIYKDSIYFEKQMPHNSTLDLRKGRREFPDKKHPVIIYVGELESENKYQGTWCFEKKWAFLFGFIPIKYSPGKGTWEMELEN